MEWIEESFLTKITTGETVKFTIFTQFINNKKYYFSRLINVDVSQFKNASLIEQKNIYGIIMTDKNYRTIYQSDKNKLIEEIKNKYPTEEIISEI